MSHSSTEGLLAAVRAADSRAAVDSDHVGPTTEPRPAVSGDDKEAELSELLKRINGLATEVGATTSASAEAHGAAGARVAPRAKLAPPPSAGKEFIPVEPASFADAHVTGSDVEGLILKLLLARGEASGRQVSDQVKLAFQLMDGILRQLKSEQLVVHKGSAPMNDYLYQLTDLGRERARRLNAHCTYFGSAPVSLADYCHGVKQQSLTTQHPTETDLKQAFDDLLVNQRMLTRLGPAINSGRGLFLYGSAGNGKTSIAERITKAFGQAIWIPRAVGIDGEIIRIFDPSIHEEMPLDGPEGLLDQRKIDKRWVRVRRPTIIVGGELTMDNLELTQNKSTGISEAPVQLKSNCGTLVIDDFGRQRMSTQELLNRWIVPLEKRYDFLNLANGKKIQVPFDQLIVFSTNLEPRDLVDEAFLRRIPYKIEISNPTEEEFRGLFKMMAPKLDFAYNEDAVSHLIDRHYKPVKRPFRCCQPRDLLLQIRNLCFYQGKAPVMSNEYMDFAVENYFAVM